MKTHRHPLASVDGLLKQREFYASAMQQASGIHRVYELAHSRKLPQLDLAQKVAQGIASSPPSDDSPHSLGAYLKKNVVSKIPRKTRYDDVFWCCLLHLLDAESVPNCSIGGPVHELVYKVYDDFDPEDVTG